MEQNKNQKNFSQQQPKKQEAPNRGNAPRPEIDLPVKGGRPETEWSQQGQRDQKREQGQQEQRNDDQRTTR